MSWNSNQNKGWKKAAAGQKAIKGKKKAPVFKKPMSAGKRTVKPR